MSGGHFTDCGYDYYKVAQFADELEQEIRHNGKAGTDGDHSNWYPDHSDEVIEYLKEQVPKLRKMSEIMRHIDYLYSADTCDDTFMERVKEVEGKWKMTDKQLSPASQAVLDAVDTLYKEEIPHDYCIMAATLRAAADQVVPIEYEDIHGCWFEKYNRVREQFLDIANELEAQ